MGKIRDNLISRIESIDNLPVLTDSVSAVSEMLMHDSVDAAQLSEVIEKDMGLVARVIRIANSTFYSGRYGEIDDVQQAIVRLGLDEVTKICIAVGTMSLFPKPTNNINLRAFWKHSLSVAIATRTFIEESAGPTVKEGQAYVAALLHDIGTLIMDGFLEEIYTAVRSAATEEKRPMHEVERTVLETDHGEISSILLQKWQFSPLVCEAVKWHHFPDGAAGDARNLAQIIHVTDFACAALGSPEPGDSVPPHGSVGAWHDTHIDIEKISAIISRVEDDMDRTGPFLDAEL